MRDVTRGARYGIHTRHAHELAESLWDTEVYGAGMVASMVDGPARVTSAQPVCIPFLTEFDLRISKAAPDMPNAHRNRGNDTDEAYDQNCRDHDWPAC